MPKLPLNNITAGFASNAGLNANFDAVEAAVENTLSRDGTGPNQMEASLDMNGNRILNLPPAVSLNEPVTYAQWATHNAPPSIFSGTSVETLSATAGQTLCTMVGLAYTPGLNNLSVYVNGVRQAGYVETSPQSITFSTPLSLGDEVLFVVDNRQVDPSFTEATSVTYTPSGTGAVSTNVQSKLRETVSPEDFGAVGDGVADDTVPLQTFFDYVLNTGTTGRRGESSNKSYRTTATITITGTRGIIDFSGSRIVPDVAVLVAVQMGTTAVILSNVQFVRLLVDRVTFSGATENVGIIYKNVAGCQFDSVESRFSKYSQVLRPDSGDRVAYNTWINIGATGGVYNVWIDQLGTGFANENVFLGGRLFTTANTINNFHAPNPSQANTNRLIAMSCEGSGERSIYINSGNWTVDNCRTEGAWSVAAIVLGTGSLRCRVLQPREDQVVVDFGAGNTIESATFKKHSQNLNGRIVQKLQRVSAPGITALGGSPTADTTAGSKVITVSSATGIALGDFLNVVGGLNFGRVEQIDGLNITTDTVASATVAGADLSRVAPPALDLSDDFYTSGNSYVQRLYMGRFGAASYFTRAFSRDSEVYNLDGSGMGYFANGVKLGSGGTQTKSILSASASLAFASIGPNSSAELTMTVTGAAVGAGSVLVSPDAVLAAGLSWCARVSATNTVAVRVINSTTGALTPATVTWRVVVLMF